MSNNSSVPTSDSTLTSLLDQLQEKIQATLKPGTNVSQTHGQAAYEALQYVQSFVARKKKALGVKGTSKAIFLSASLILAANDQDPNAVKLEPSAVAGKSLMVLSPSPFSVAVGSLLKWYIEEGAGAEYAFHFHPEGLPKDKKNPVYCDVQNLLDLITPLADANGAISGPIVDAIYAPLHMNITKMKTPVRRGSALFVRVQKLDGLCARALLKYKKFMAAFKAFARLEDTENAVETLRQWSLEGYQHEGPLFFGRGLLHLLAEGKVELAHSMYFIAKPHVSDNTGPDATPGGPSSAPLAVWHLAVTLTELSAMPPMQRVDKSRLFGILYNRYASFLAQLDTKLLDLLIKIGEVCFNYYLEGSSRESSGPMSLFQQMLGGGNSASNRQQQQTVVPSGAQRAASNPSNGAGGMDINTLMTMMNRLQQAQGK